ncbi:MAG: hypothetical protein ABFE08_02735 [Armatimonadia bacterium]
MSFELENYRMFLAGAPSDRFTERGDYVRWTVLLGVPVLIDPKYSDAVAEVKLNVSVEDNTPGTVPGKGLRVIRMMPQQKTYNRAVYTSDTRALSLGAAIGAVAGIGGTYSNSDNRMYLVADTDTLAVPMYPRGDQDSITFGWQFKPVLGRRTVEPSHQLLFVMLGLPDEVAKRAYESQGYAPKIHISVTTSWHRFKLDAPLGPVIEGSSVPAPKPTCPRVTPYPNIGPFDEVTHARCLQRLAPPSTLPWWATQSIDVNQGENLKETASSPWIDGTTVKRLGGGLYEATWRGSNLSGAQVRLGDTVFGPTTGLMCLGSTTLRAELPIAKLALADPVIVGSTGVSTSGVEKDAKQYEDARQLVRNPSHPQMNPNISADKTQYNVTIALPEPRTETDEAFWPDLVKTTDPWFVVAGDKVLDLPGNAYCKDSNTLVFNIDANLLASVDKLILRQGLMGLRNAFEIDVTLTDRFSVDKLQVMAQAPDEADFYYVGLSGHHLSDSICLQVGKTEMEPMSEFKDNPRHLLVFKVPGADVQSQDRALVWRKGQSKTERLFPLLIGLTKDLKVPSPQKAIELPPVVEGKAVPIHVTGSRVQDVVAVFFNNQELDRYKPASKPGEATPKISTGQRCADAKGFFFLPPDALVQGSERTLVFKLKQEGSQDEETLVIALPVQPNPTTGAAKSR